MDTSLKRTLSGLAGLFPTEFTSIKRTRKKYIQPEYQKSIFYYYYFFFSLKCFSYVELLSVSRSFFKIAILLPYYLSLISKNFIYTGPANPLNMFLYLTGEGKRGICTNLMGFPLWSTLFSNFFLSK